MLSLSTRNSQVFSAELLSSPARPIAQGYSVPGTLGFEIRWVWLVHAPGCWSVQQPCPPAHQPLLPPPVWCHRSQVTVSSAHSRRLLIRCWTVSAPSPTPQQGHWQPSTKQSSIHHHTTLSPYLQWSSQFSTQPTSTSPAWPGGCYGGLHQQPWRETKCPSKHYSLCPPKELSHLRRWDEI